MKKQSSQADGADCAGEVEGQGVTGGREEEGLSLKDVVHTPSVNGTPTHKKSLPVRTLMLGISMCFYNFSLHLPKATVDCYVDYLLSGVYENKRPPTDQSDCLIQTN